MRVTQKLLVVLFVCLLLVACSGSGKGSKFVGQWQGKDAILTITKNGDSFVCESSGRPGEKFPASLREEGTLVMVLPIQNIKEEFGMIVSEDGKTLYAMGQEFKRVGK